MISYVVVKVLFKLICHKMIHCRVSPTPQISVSKAPPPHPHMLDPFQEVKEYMLEAEDYAHFLNDKVNVSKIFQSCCEKC